MPIEEELDLPQEEAISTPSEVAQKEVQIEAEPPAPQRPRTTVVNVFGPAGSGKTTFLKQFENVKFISTLDDVTTDVAQYNGDVFVKMLEAFYELGMDMVIIASEEPIEYDCPHIRINTLVSN